MRFTVYGISFRFAIHYDGLNFVERKMFWAKFGKSVCENCEQKERSTNFDWYSIGWWQLANEDNLSTESYLSIPITASFRTDEWPTNININFFVIFFFYFFFLFFWKM